MSNWRMAIEATEQAVRPMVGWNGSNPRNLERTVGIVEFYWPVDSPRFRARLGRFRDLPRVHEGFWRIMRIIFYGWSPGRRFSRILQGSADTRFTRGLEGPRPAHLFLPANPQIRLSNRPRSAYLVHEIGPMTSAPKTLSPKSASARGQGPQSCSATHTSTAE